MSGVPGTVEYGLRLNCEKEGCLEKYGHIHSDNGRVQIQTDWRPPLHPEDLAYSLEDGRINNHACDVVTRRMPEWETLDDAQIAEVVASLRAS